MILKKTRATFTNLVFSASNLLVLPPHGVGTKAMSASEFIALMQGHDFVICLLLKAMQGHRGEDAWELDENLKGPISGVKFLKHGIEEWWPALG